MLLAFHAQSDGHAPTDFLLAFIPMSIGLLYSLTFLSLTLYHFCRSRAVKPVVTNEISALQILIALYVGFWSLKHFLVCIILGVLFFELDHRVPVDVKVLDFVQSLIGSTASKLLYVVILFRIYFTFKDTIHKLSRCAFTVYLMLLLLAWSIDVVADVLVLLHRESIFIALYAVAVSLQIALGLIFIYQFNHRLFQLILSQSEWSYHYGSTTKGSPPQNSLKSQSGATYSASNSMAQSAPNSAHGTPTPMPTATRLDRSDSLLLNPKQLSLLDIITKNSLLASTAIIAYDIFIILYVALELYPYELAGTRTLIALFYVQSAASFIEIFSIYLTFNWSASGYSKCCKCCHNECLKCCRDIAKRKIAKHCRHHSVYSIPLEDTDLI